jgi:hypothetical protein
VKVKKVLSIQGLISLICARLTVAQISFKSKLSTQRLYQIKKNKSTYLTVPTLIKLLKAFDARIYVHIEDDIYEIKEL